MDSHRRVYPGYGRHGFHEGKCLVHVLIHENIEAPEKLLRGQIVAE